MDAASSSVHHTSEADRSRTVQAGRHQKILAMLRQLVSLGEVPPGALRPIMAAAAQHQPRGCARPRTRRSTARRCRPCPSHQKDWHRRRERRRRGAGPRLGPYRELACTRRSGGSMRVRRMLPEMAKHSPMDRYAHRCPGPRIATPTRAAIAFRPTWHKSARLQEKPTVTGLFPHPSGYLP
jgi:hypothetical protein